MVGIFFKSSLAVSQAAATGPRRKSVARVGFVYKDIGGAALFIDSLPAVRDGSKHDPVQLERPITISLREDLFIERTTPQAPTKPNTRKPARLAIV